MGSFYTNITVYGVDHNALVNYLKQIERFTFVSPTENDYTVIFDAITDDQSINGLDEFAAKLYAKFKCPAFAILNHDDVVLWYKLFNEGVLADEYVSAPEWIDEDAEPGQGPKGGNAVLLCDVFHRPQESAKVKSILEGKLSETGFATEVERHFKIANALGMPKFAVGLGYNYIESGLLFPGFEELEFTRTGDAPFVFDGEPIDWPEG